MFKTAIMVGVAVLIGAVPATAQKRGTMEFGAFGSNTSWDNSLNMNSNWGAGGRVGVFIVPRLSAEFEGGGGSASRSLGLADVNVGVLSGRLTAVPFKFGSVSVLLGAGVDHTDTYFFESYGVHALLGAKVRLSDYVALRIDGINSWMANGNGQQKGLHLGLSFYRHPGVNTVTNTVMVPGPQLAQRPDSVSAYETRRLRAAAANYQALRDSLNRPKFPGPASSAEALATMQQMIHFQNDQSDLSDSAKAILDDKVTVFRANPAMRIVISGFASQPGTVDYNMALGLRRAEAAKAYLVSRGVDPIRIEIATKGEGQLLVEGPGEVADAQNRRGQFRLLIADPYLAAPKQ
jgi:outer membrane protein OmpA-like peptidoglycan-associated protein